MFGTIRPMASSSAEQGGGVDDRIRVLYVLDQSWGGGGAERLATSVIAGLDESRFDRYLCFTRPTEERSKVNARAAGITILELNRRSKLDLLPWLRLMRLLRAKRIDVLHTHKHGSNFWGAIISGIVRTPVFFAHEHSWPYTGDRLRVLVDRFLISRRATQMIAVSEADKQLMIAVEHIDSDRITILPNGIAPPVVGDVEALRAELRIAPGAPVIVCVGARPEKRVDRLLRAFAEITVSFPDARLLVIGRSSDEEGLQALVDELGLGALAQLLGNRTDVATILELADIAVIASDREGSPLAVLEYMAAGCGIVAARVGGIPDMVGDGVEGILIDPADHEELTEAVSRLLRDPSLREQLGAAARERQIREFSLAHVVALTGELYESAFAATGRGTRPATIGGR